MKIYRHFKHFFYNVLRHFLFIEKRFLVSLLLDKKNPIVCLQFHLFYCFRANISLNRLVFFLFIFIFCFHCTTRNYTKVKYIEKKFLTLPQISLILNFKKRFNLAAVIQTILDIECFTSFFLHFFTSFSSV